jgi:hypothetical protein
MRIMRKKILGQVIFLAAAFLVGVIVFALNAYPAVFAGRERVTCGLAMAIAGLGATAHFVGVTYRLAVVAVGIATAAYAYYFLGNGPTPPWGLLAHFF